ncbi:aspartate 1-decarboxylase, partial [Enterococcus faecalis]|nr:aspartate 1-decarboxylase [Enterococcus faecalis]
MFKEILNGKIHRATVTDANLSYIGSITIAKDLMELANIEINEKVQIVNNNNGERFETYTIEGKSGSGVICLNGAAARKVQIGDEIIILSYCMLEKNEIISHTPNIVFL